MRGLNEAKLERLHFLLRIHSSRLRFIVSHPPDCNLTKLCIYFLESWYRSEWSSCSRTCGKGVQKRQIHCRRKISQTKYEILPDSSCSGNKPSEGTKRSCNEVICHVEWMATNWSQVKSSMHVLISSFKFQFICFLC